MLMGEFMTAVHHRLPVKAVVYNNSALGLITLEAESVGAGAVPRSHRTFQILISRHWPAPAAGTDLRRASRVN